MTNIKHDSEREADKANDEDPIFLEEQTHLSETYGKLKAIANDAAHALDERLKSARGDKANMLDELFVDFGNGVNLETYVEFEAMHKVIDEYNLANDMDAQRLDTANLLMRKPYFAKVSLQLRPGTPARDIYIGTAGITDEKRRHFIVDWRSPIAETYYNQANGKTSYTANGRTIEAELLCRRQFDIEGDKLNAYFDTTVAIEDPLLLASLARGRNDKLSDITATIQREQNTVVRHDDVDVLLVNGIAGSGKTSVLLQRIAYLFYQQRENLSPRDVYLITPNSVFQRYIDNVLPDMGEENPQTLTWDDLMATLKLDNRDLGKQGGAEDLRLIDELLPGLVLDGRDFADLKIDDEVVLSASTARNAYRQFKSIPAGPHHAALAADELHERLAQRIKRLSRSEDTFDAMMDLDHDEMMRIFGMPIQPASESEFQDYARTYLKDRYAPIEEAIENGEWLRIDRIGMRMLKKKALNSAEWLYLKLALAGGSKRSARYVMVDEVQDYSCAQLMVLARYFNNAHFLLLGDPNQAIKAGTASFDEIRQIFSAARGEVHECQLMTSYRSSPEITKLFTSLMPANERIKTSSIQRPGYEPCIKEYLDTNEYQSAVRAEIERMNSEAEGLAAVIVAEKSRVKWMAKWLDDSPAIFLDKHDELPESGVLVMDVALAKGLEFEQVLIADAQQEVYTDDELSRCRLYTALSRATQKVSVISQGPLTNLL